MKKIELITSVILEDGEGENKQNVTNHPGAVLDLDDATANKLIAEGKAKAFPPPAPDATSEESGTSLVVAGSDVTE